MLAHIDWNDKMKNKTGAESWNILKSELDSVISTGIYNVWSMRLI